ncbi:MAG: DUF2851 family protein [Calditrichaeota bacterium]|nr:MAG: DUF2851 family protein [Calditrichota bacterium]
MMPSEESIQKFWESGFLIGKKLCLTTKEPLKILTTGLRNFGKGPDFLESEIQIGKQVLRGDIEIHKNSSDWNQHLHFSDPNYNSVILHVVVNPNAEIWTENGRTIPTVSLEKFLEKNIVPQKFSTKKYSCSEKTDNLPVPEILQIIEKQAETRLNQKYKDLQQRFADSPDFTTLLYEKTAEALGYSKNQTPMLKLARKLPLSLLRGVLNSTEIPPEKALELLFLQTSGFLNEEIKSKEINFLRNFEKMFAVIPLQRKDWNLFQVRPNNHPKKRIEILTIFVKSFLQENYLQNLVLGISELETPKELEKFVLNYFLPLKSSLGKNRKETLVLNVLIPVLRIYAEEKNETSILSSLKMLLQNLNSGEQNSAVKKVLENLTLEPALEKFLKKSAFYQQGLLHIAKNYCQNQDSKNCPFNNF